jgi:hypothetical protein
MECPVCYAASASLTIRCGHAFCKECVHKWLTSSKEEGKPGCPMCRTPIYFRGLRKLESKLEEERCENMYSDAMGCLIEATAELLSERIENIPFKSPALKEWQKEMLEEHAMFELKSMEETFKALKNIYWLHPVDILEEIADGVEVSYKRSEKKLRKEGWQRDKRSERVHRHAPRMNIRR